MVTTWAEEDKRQRWTGGRLADVTERYRRINGVWVPVTNRYIASTDSDDGGSGGGGGGGGTGNSEGAGYTPTIPTGYTLSKQWLFDGTSMPSEWSITAAPTGGGNTATSRASNTTIRDSFMRIQASSPSYATYYSSDWKTYGSGFGTTGPNFWAEVRFRAPCVQYVGAFPCPLWFRPYSGSGGEFDVTEMYGSDTGTTNGSQCIATLFSAENYPNGAKDRRRTYLKNMAAPYNDPYGWHTLTFLKEAQQARVWTDGVLMGTWTPDTLSALGGTWASTWPTGTRWGLRTDLYVNSSGKTPSNVITSAAWSSIDWSQFYMDVDYIAIANPA